MRTVYIDSPLSSAIEQAADVPVGSGILARMVESHEVSRLRLAARVSNLRQRQSEAGLCFPLVEVTR